MWEVRYRALDKGPSEVIWSTWDLVLDEKPLCYFRKEESNTVKIINDQHKLGSDAQSKLSEGSVGGRNLAEE